MVQILHSIASFIRTGRLLQDPDILLLLLSIAIYLSDNLLSYTGLATSLIGATTPPPFLVYFLTSALALPCCWGQSSRHHPRSPQPNETGIVARHHTLPQRPVVSPLIMYSSK